MQEQSMPAISRAWRTPTGAEATATAFAAATLAILGREGCFKSVPAARFGAHLTFGCSPRPCLTV